MSRGADEIQMEAVTSECLLPVRQNSENSTQESAREDDDDLKHIKAGYEILPRSECWTRDQPVRLWWAVSPKKKKTD